MATQEGYRGISWWLIAGTLLLAVTPVTLLGQATAGLSVTIAGLPSGVNSQVTVLGAAGYSQVLTATATLTGLTPGAFTIRAGVVPGAAGAIYIPSIYPGASVQASAGQVAAVTVEFEVLTPTWQSAGPSAIQGWAGGLAAAGEIRPIAVNNSNPQVMFAGSGGDGYVGPTSISGIYKTADGGATWVQANTGLTDPLIEAVWLDQFNPNTVLAGTQSHGIFRSTDGGAHWSQSQTCSAITSPVGAATAFVQVAGVLYAGSNVGLLRSTDNGVTWCMEQATNSPVWEVAASGNTIYVGLEDGHVMARANSTAAWVAAIPSPAAARVWYLAVHPTNPNICYAIANASNTSPLYLTKDGGNTWSAVASLKVPILQAVAFQPGNPQVIFAGWDGQIVRSTDGGTTWNNLAGTNWDIRSIYPDAAGITGRVLVGSDQGAYISRDNGATWSSLNGNLTSSILYSIAVSGSTILATAQDYPALASFDGGKSWAQVNNTTESGMVFINPGNPSYAYFWTGSGMFYSTDGGKTLQPPTAPAGSLTAASARPVIAVDPSTPSTVYLGEGINADLGHGVYVSSDWGKTFSSAKWSAVPSPTAIAVDPTDSRTIFVASGVQIDSQTYTNALYFTHDGGSTWTKSTFNGNPGFAGINSVMTLAIDPFNSRNVVAGLEGSILNQFGNGIYVSTDGGATFSQANNGLIQPTVVWGGMVLSLAFSPWYPGLLAAATPSGLYLTSDLGSHWITLQSNAATYFFSGASWATGNLYASTFGQGALKMPFSAPLQIVPASANFAAAGAAGVISVGASAASGPWTAISTAPWITITSGAAGSGSGAIAYSVAPNPSTNARIGGITIGGFTFSVSQAGAIVPGAPLISAVVNVDYAPTIAAGSWIVIEGSNLATAAGDWSSAVVNGALPTSLNNVSVSVDGMPAYLYFVSPGQINAQAPDSTSVGPVSVVVTSNGLAGPPFTVQMNPVSPALFLWPQSYVVATHLDYSLAANNGLFSNAVSTPAQPGETIILWGTGLGKGGAAGTIPQTTYTISAPVIVHFGSLTAVAAAVAAGAGEISVDQIVVTVPAGLSAGDYTIGIEIGGSIVPTGKLTVAASQ